MALRTWSSYLQFVVLKRFSLQPVIESMSSLDSVPQPYVKFMVAQDSGVAIDDLESVKLKLIHPAFFLFGSQVRGAHGEQGLSRLDLIVEINNVSLPRSDFVCWKFGQMLRKDAFVCLGCCLVYCSGLRQVPQ